MIRNGFVLGLSLALVGFASAQVKTPVASGPKVGGDISPFHPYNVTGESAGKKACLVCQFSSQPVAVVFAREVTPAVGKLIKQIDAANIKHKGAEMGSFVVFCSNDDKLEAQLKDFAKQQDLKETILSIDNPTGPKAFQISSEAEVTVVLYTEFEVKANHAFRKGELTDAGIDAVVADISKILPVKK